MSLSYRLNVTKFQSANFSSFRAVEVSSVEIYNPMPTKVKSTSHMFSYSEILKFSKVKYLKLRPPPHIKFQLNQSKDLAVTGI